MKKPLVYALFLGLLSALPASALGETAPAPAAPQEKSFTQSVMDGYHSLKSNVSQALGGYNGEEEHDGKLFMEQYHKDLSQYHEAMREARDEYRRARLDDQKAYLEHHESLPVNENLDAVCGTPAK